MISTRQILKKPVFFYPLMGALFFFCLFLLAEVILPCLYIDLFPEHYYRETHNDRVVIDYWEKWTDFEGEAMQEIVDLFNSSQDRIFVKKHTISRIDQRFLVSVAGKNPPDVAGLSAYMIPNFAEKGALRPLDEYASKYDIQKKDYIPVFWDLGVYKKELYALPTTPVTLALHYNKTMFREAGLDPDKPPSTLQELDEMANKLTRYDENGDIEVIGFTPSYPGWWHWAWGFLFGGELQNDDGEIKIDAPENIKAFVWIQNYARNFGVENLQTFQSGLGTFNSPQNPFISEKVAMEIQGVWMYNFIKNYNPDLEWGAAPFPSGDPKIRNWTLADCDNLVIPADARHPDEAFEFIAFVQKQKYMENLCLGQRKFSPLKKVSDTFWEKHPHPFIRLFSDLAKSPNAKTQPMIPVFQQIRDEMKSAFSEIWLLEKTPEQALGDVQERIEREWRDHIQRVNMRKRRRDSGK